MSRARARLAKSRIVAATGMALALALAAQADEPTMQSPDGRYVIAPKTLDGGTVSANGNQRIAGSVGQADAGPVLAAGTYEITGGVRRRAPVARPDALFANGFEN